jgi:hypothetical protein
MVFDGQGGTLHLPGRLPEAVGPAVPVVRYRIKATPAIRKVY